MTQQPFQSEYISAQNLNLLPVDLFNHVRAGRLHPLDEYTGKAIPRPDVLRIHKELKKIEDAIARLPLSPEQRENLFNRAKSILERARLKKQRQVHVSKEEHFALTCMTDYRALSKKLKAITDIYDWTTYRTPENPIPDFAVLQNALFKKSEIEQLNITDGRQSPAQESAPETQVEPVAEEPVREEPGNYFRRIDADHWAIQFGDEVIQYINHVDGFFYIARLLSNPGESISDVDLQSGNINGHPRATALINEGLNINAPSRQEINDKTAQDAYKEKYHQLQSDLVNADSDLERAEIEKEIGDFLKYFPIKQKGSSLEPIKHSFVLPENKAAQANLTKRLNLAYDRIAKVMPILSEHLREHIKTKNFKRKYTGGLKWDVTQ